MTKFIFVTGGVVSSLGKGSSAEEALASIMQQGNMDATTNYFLQQALRSME